MDLFYREYHLFGGQKRLWTTSTSTPSSTVQNGARLMHENNPQRGDTWQFVMLMYLLSICFLFREKGAVSGGGLKRSPREFSDFLLLHNVIFAPTGSSKQLTSWGVRLGAAKRAELKLLLKHGSTRSGQRPSTVAEHTRIQ